MVDQPFEEEFYKEIAAASGTQRYRLVWHQALESFDMNGQPFGKQVPIEQRVSNPFMLEAP